MLLTEKIMGQAERQEWRKLMRQLFFIGQVISNGFDKTVKYQVNDDRDFIESLKTKTPEELILLREKISNKLPQG